MNKLKTAIRNAEVDGLSDSIIRNFKADEKAQTDSFLKSALEELETLSAQITTAILQDKTLSTLDSADSVRDEAVKTLGTVLAAYAVFPLRLFFSNEAVTVFARHHSEQRSIFTNKRT